MPISLTMNYDQSTKQLDKYIQDCCDTAAQSTWAYEKKEAALRADGAIRFWMCLFMVEVAKLGPDAEKCFGEDLVRLRTLVKNISLDDQP